MELSAAFDSQICRHTAPTSSPGATCAISQICSGQQRKRVDFDRAR